ncbi:MAG TPA: hypothetical protein VIK78_01080 [Ruminiclostridium sp.]
MKNFRKHFFKRDKDMYVIGYGDSIMAWQSSMVSADEGVTRVPPVCDRKGLCWYLWRNIKFGDPQYRRFDDGKNSLVGEFDNTWAGGDIPIFTETGAFKTHYYGNTNSYPIPLNSPQFTTMPTNEVCEITSFHEIDSQRNIPKRICRDPSGSVEFIIPGGYEKFDFIYHTNAEGDDNVTVTIMEADGKVIVKNNNVDWSNGVEANGHLFSMRETHSGREDGYDSGVLQKRLYFKKNNREEVITVKIAKSRDTSKYMLYWGISYWGTLEEPNAIHLINNARGGHTIQKLYNTRFYDLSIWNADLIIFQNTLLNNAGDTAEDPENNYVTSLDEFIIYVQSLNIDWVTLLPHASTTLVDNSMGKYKIFWNQAKQKLISEDIPVIDIEEALYKIWETQNPNQEVSYSKFISNLMYDGSLHGNEKAYAIYGKILNPIFKIK